MVMGDRGRPGKTAHSMHDPLRIASIHTARHIGTWLTILRAVPAPKPTLPPRLRAPARLSG